MAKLNVITYALVAFAAVGVFALTAYTDAGDASPTTTAQPAAGAAAPHAATPSAEPYRYQPRYPREDLPCNPPGTWEVYPSPTTSDLYCVDFVDANNGWAGGRNVALRYRNGTWSEIPGHRGHEFSDIDMLSTTDGWAVGWNGLKEEPAIWRWNGSEWIEFQNPSGAVFSIDMVDSNHGWIGGNRYFLRFNGTQWLSAGNGPGGMYGIHMNSDTDGRATGYGYVLRRVGSAWNVEANNNDWNLGSIKMVNASKGWITGQTLQGEKGILLEYTGTWREYQVYEKARSIARLDIYQGDFGWAVGWRTVTPPYGAFLLFYDGLKWEEVSAPWEKATLGVKIIDRNNAWIVGYAGLILKYKPNVSVKETSMGKIKAIYR